MELNKIKGFWRFWVDSFYSPLKVSSPAAVKKKSPEIAKKKKRGIMRVFLILFFSTISVLVYPFTENYINRLSTFQNVIPQETRVILVGNNNYSKTPLYDNLEYCIDDTRLVKELLIKCCKIKESNITLLNDISVDEFRSAIISFSENINPQNRVLFYYSGHGNKGGSLVFTDGKELASGELQSRINRLNNDAVMIIDACHSGAAEETRDFTDNSQAYRDNTLRIYAALAHHVAKEINYGNNPFFDSVLPFYREVLGLEDIRGNGYFTALLGLFFASYQLKPYENISFGSLVSFITNKGSRYVEYENTRNKNSKNIQMRIDTSVYQQPKLHPIQKLPEFRKEEHLYILYQNPTLKQPKNRFTVTSNISGCLPVTYSDSLNMGFMTLINVHYNISLGRNKLGLGIQTGISGTESTEKATNLYENYLIPFALYGSFNLHITGPLYIVVDTGLGACFNYLNYKDDTLPDLGDLKMYLSAGTGIGFYMSDSVSAALKINYSLFIPYKQPFMVLSPGIEMSCHLK